MFQVIPPLICETGTAHKYKCSQNTQRGRTPQEIFSQHLYLFHRDYSTQHTQYVMYQLNVSCYWYIRLQAEVLLCFTILSRGTAVPRSTNSCLPSSTNKVRRIRMNTRALENRGQSLRVPCLISWTTGYQQWEQWKQKTNWSSENGEICIFIFNFLSSY